MSLKSLLSILQLRTDWLLRIVVMLTVCPKILNLSLSLPNYFGYIAFTSVLFILLCSYKSIREHKSGTEHF
jgi:hypothetical protein